MSITALAYSLTPKHLYDMGVKNVYAKLLNRRLKAIKRILFRDEILRIEENLFEARYHKL